MADFLTFADVKKEFETIKETTEGFETAYLIMSNDKEGYGFYFQPTGEEKDGTLPVIAGYGVTMFMFEEMAEGVSDDAVVRFDKYSLQVTSIDTREEDNRKLVVFHTEAV